MDIELIFFSVMIVVALAEMVLSGLWNRAYFTVGIPIFRRHVTLPVGVAPSPERLEAAVRGKWSAPLRFRLLQMGEIAFREQAFGGGLVHYTPVMHGVIRRGPSGAGYVVDGLLNWFVVAFTTLVLATTLREAPEFALFLALGLSLLYALQRRRFLRVAEVLATSPAG